MVGDLVLVSLEVMLALVRDPIVNPIYGKGVIAILIKWYGRCRCYRSNLYLLLFRILL